MEDLLDLYAQPHDPKRPLVCFDEHPIALRGDKRPSLEATTTRPERYDYEFVRQGKRQLLMAFDPHAGWRRVWIHEQRTKREFALALCELAEVHYPKADKIVLVVDNLNTHKLSALYEHFEPAKARDLAARFEVHFTPKHASWLNMVEIEIGVMVGQCLHDRYDGDDELSGGVRAWENRRNKQRATINWSFTTDKAREKLKRLYPSIQMR